MLEVLEIAETLGRQCNCGGQLIRLWCNQPCQNESQARCEVCGKFNGWLPKEKNKSKSRRPASERGTPTHDYCEYCLSGAHELPKWSTLSDHHVIEFQYGGRKNNSPLWTLCSECHLIVDRHRKIGGAQLSINDAVHEDWCHGCCRFESELQADCFLGDYAVTDTQHGDSLWRLCTDCATHRTMTRELANHRRRNNGSGEFQKRAG